jgi:hypothetical protein
MYQLISTPFCPRSSWAKQIIYEPEARIVRDIFNWYTVGRLTGHGIARRLSEVRIPTSGESRGFQRKRESGMWCAETVFDILSNETYAGVWHYGKIERKGNNNKKRDISQTIAISVPAIVLRETWNEAQNRRKENKKTSRRQHPYLVSGRVTCGCGKSMAGCGNGGGKKYHYYACNTLTHRHSGIEDRGCKERSVRAEALDQAAWNFALYAKRTYAEFKAMLEEQQEKQRQGFLPVQQRTGQVQKELAEVTQKIQRIAGLMSDTDLPPEAKAEFTQNLVIASRQKESLTQEQEELAQKLTELQELMLSDDDILSVLTTREREIAKLQSATFEEKRRYVEKIDLRVKIKDGVAHFSSRLPVNNKDLSEVAVSGAAAKALLIGSAASSSPPSTPGESGTGRPRRQNAPACRWAHRGLC